MAGFCFRVAVASRPVSTEEKIGKPLLNCPLHAGASRIPAGLRAAIGLRAASPRRARRPNRNAPQIHAMRGAVGRMVSAGRVY